MMDGQTVWKGDVEDDQGEEHFMAVINVPPVKDPSDAVKAAIASGKQK